MDRLCLHCGADISHKRKDARYCSTICNKAPRFRGTYCICCKKELIVAQANKSRTKYCSSECLHSSVYLVGNRDYFAEPNLENSYWAGFIAADGCILTPKTGSRSLVINLKRGDKEHLVALKDAIGAGTIYDYEHYDRKRDRTYIGSRYRLFGNDMCADLAENFNIHPRKTSKHKPPVGLSEDQTYAFIAGYIDGDGCYYKPKDKNRGALNVAGTLEFLTWLAAVYGIEKNPKLQSGIYTITFFGNDAIRIRDSFLNLPIPHLKRKINLWEERGANVNIIDYGENIK